MKILKEIFKLLISKSGAFNYCFESIRVKSFMSWNSYPVSAVRHADVLALSDDFKTCFNECPDSAVRRDISKEHVMRGPLLRTPSHSSSLQLSSGGMS